MGRKKKISFKLNPEWMFKEPLDFEYNKYTLLDYLQKCEKGFDKMEVYPDFVELSLHLANLQSIVKENTLLLTNKKFESCDDEILVKELIAKKPRELSKEEENELSETIKFSGSKLFDAFNMAKAIWNIAYDSVDVQIKKNKAGLVSGSGYIFYYQKDTESLFVWEYQIKKPKTDNQNNKTYINLIYNGPVDKLTMTNIIDTFSTWNTTDFYHNLPIFEMKCSQKLPMEQTIIPIMKRKVMAYVFQVVNFEKINNNFDSEL
jgi:hypothetical protein